MTEQQGLDNVSSYGVEEFEEVLQGLRKGEQASGLAELAHTVWKNRIDRHRLFVSEQESEFPPLPKRQSITPKQISESASKGDGIARATEGDPLAELRRGKKQEKGTHQSQYEANPKPNPSLRASHMSPAQGSQLREEREGRILGACLQGGQIQWQVKCASDIVEMLCRGTVDKQHMAASAMYEAEELVKNLGHSAARRLAKCTALKNGYPMTANRLSEWETKLTPAHAASTTVHLPFRAQVESSKRGEGPERQRLDNRESRLRDSVESAISQSQQGGTKSQSAGAHLRTNCLTKCLPSNVQFIGDLLVARAADAAARGGEADENIANATGSLERLAELSGRIAPAQRPGQKHSQEKQNLLMTRLATREAAPFAELLETCDSARVSACVARAASDALHFLESNPPAFGIEAQLRVCRSLGSLLGVTSASPCPDDNHQRRSLPMFATAWRQCDNWGMVARSVAWREAALRMLVHDAAACQCESVLTTLAQCASLWELARKRAAADVRATFVSLCIEGLFSHLLYPAEGSLAPHSCVQVASGALAKAERQIPPFSEGESSVTAERDAGWKEPSPDEALSTEFFIAICPALGTLCEIADGFHDKQPRKGEPNFKRNEIRRARLEHQGGGTQEELRKSFLATNPVRSFTGHLLKEKRKDLNRAVQFLHEEVSEAMRAAKEGECKGRARELREAGDDISDAGHRAAKEAAEECSKECEERCKLIGRLLAGSAQTEARLNMASAIAHKWTMEKLERALHQATVRWLEAVRMGEETSASTSTSKSSANNAVTREGDTDISRVHELASDASMETFLLISSLEEAFKRGGWVSVCSSDSPYEEGRWLAAVCLTPPGWFRTPGEEYKPLFTACAGACLQSMPKRWAAREASGESILAGLFDKDIWFEALREPWVSRSPYIRSRLSGLAGVAKELSDRSQCTREQASLAFWDATSFCRQYLQNSDGMAALTAAEHAFKAAFPDNEEG